jgi:hypothetical protein
VGVRPPRGEVASSVEAAFAELAGDNYPGSTRKRKAVAAKAAEAPPEEDRWDSSPYMQKVDGELVEFFFVGAVAQALGRSSNTIRRWIEYGTIPQARFRINAVSIKGSRRLWTRAQVEGMRRIAREEGLFDGRNVGATQFSERVTELFRQLKKEGRL